MASEVNDAKAAVTALAAAIAGLASDLRAGVIEPAEVEDLAKQIWDQAASLNEAIAAAKSARGEGS